MAKSGTHKKDNRPKLRTLKQEIKKSRNADLKRHTKPGAAETEACLEDQDLQGAWTKLNLWMKNKGDKAFGPSFEDMTKLWALSGTWEKWNLAPTLIGLPCVPTSGEPTASGASFPSFSRAKLLTPASLACFARLWCRWCCFLVVNLGL